MTKIDLENDFNEIVDNLEVVTLRRRDSSKEFVVETAYRQQVQTQESEPSSGDALQTRAVWHLQLPTSDLAPHIGDVVIDLHSNRWTILETEQLALLGRWKCTVRELRLAYGCHDRVDIERPIWGDNGSGPEIVSWTKICVALPVKIQLDEMLLDTSTDPPTKQLFYDIILSESIALEPNDRFSSENGNSYRLQSLQQSDRIDALPIAHALREESA